MVMENDKLLSFEELVKIGVLLVVVHGRERE
jgi:hypothetical protein